MDLRPALDLEAAAPLVWAVVAVVVEVVAATAVLLAVGGTAIVPLLLREIEQWRCAQGLLACKQGPSYVIQYLYSEIC